MPLVKGSLIQFDGTILHNTIVQSGSVRLLGPFHIQSMMMQVLEAPEISAHFCANECTNDGRY